ncbi:MAG: hypothetical protein JO078_11590 [Candidatus Eremiobacteraeota bacterium]|nr:hypothetical protein [Candidatus Eremiobacteraeota bacterium]MBV9057448.1 hypothetical protein [Candidatus Eremiobacteraeota bacterium]MBV9700752.1 hypothetical protein [Candidatus Eremiobacteraeota bacterium]
MTIIVGPFKADKLWVDPNHGGGLLLAHVDMPLSAGSDHDKLDAIDAGMRKGLAALVGGKAVSQSKRVKICNGTQTGMYAKVALPTIKEDLVLSVSDRAYVAEYVRKVGTPDDPAALDSLMSLCAP